MSTIANAAYDDIDISAVRVDLINQDPDPVNPGSYVDLRFQISNEGSREVNDVQVELVLPYPFSLDTNEVATRMIPVLAGYQKGDNSIIVKYKVRVDEKAIEGENPIKIKWKQNYDWIERKFDVNIRTVDATVSVESVETMPEQISPGDRAEVNIKIKNVADSVMKDVTFKLDLAMTTLSSLFSTTSTTASTTAADSIFDLIPIAPLDSTTEKKIQQIMPGETVNLEFNVIAYPDAESRVYKVPIQITYFDELENSYTKNDIVSLVVGAMPEIIVDLESSEIFEDDSKGNIVVKFINKGLTDIKFLIVTLEDNGDYETLSTNDVYIGNVDSDDYETAEYDIYVKSTSKSEITIPIKYSYRNTDNLLFEESVDLSIKLFDDKTALKLGYKQPDKTMQYALILAIILIAYVIYRVVKSRSRKE
ncbi:COG1361 S-layer family protein [Nanoarchaeota archaeon]